MRTGPEVVRLTGSGYGAYIRAALPQSDPFLRSVICAVRFLPSALLPSASAFVGRSTVQRFRESESESASDRRVRV